MKVQVIRNANDEVIGLNATPPVIAAENSQILEVPDDDPLVWAARRIPLYEKMMTELDVHFQDIADSAYAARDEIEGTWYLLKQMGGHDEY